MSKMAIFSEYRLFFVFVFLTFCHLFVLLLASDDSNGTSFTTPISAPLYPQQSVINQPNSKDCGDPSRTARAAANTNDGANATATDAGSGGNGTATEDAMTTTVDWWSSLATQPPPGAQMDSAVSSTNSSAASASPAVVAASSLASAPNSTSNSSDNSTATKNDAPSRPVAVQLCTVLLLVAVEAMAVVTIL